MVTGPADVQISQGTQPNQATVIALLPPSLPLQHLTQRDSGVTVQDDPSGTYHVTIKAHCIFTHLQTLSLKVKQISFSPGEGLGITKLSASRDPVKFQSAWLIFAVV